LAEGNTWLGDWHFETLPRVGERIVLPPDYFVVIEIEHWPVTSVDPEDMGLAAGLRVWVKAVPSPR
jgi:hypothetical protein